MSRSKKGVNPFRLAKERYSRKAEHYRFGVCAVLAELYGDSCIPYADYIATEQIIERLLEGNSWLEDWLTEKGHALFEECYRHSAIRDHKKMRQTRLNWLTWLAGEWDKGVRK